MDFARHIDHVVRWSWRRLRFEFGCDDPEVLQRLQSVTSRWGDSGEDPGTAVCTMTVTRSGSGWLFKGSQPGAKGFCADIGCVVRAAEADATLAILNRPDLYATVHGALVIKNGGGVLLVGPSMAGKSTLAWALWQAGWQLAGDDVAVLDNDEHGHWTAAGVPRRVSLRETSRSLLGDSQWHELKDYDGWEPTDEGVVFFPNNAAEAAHGSKLSAVIFLEPPGLTESAPVPRELLQPLHPADALMKLCPYTNIARCGGGIGECLSRLSPVMDQVPVFTLQRSDLKDTIGAIDALVADQQKRAASQ